MKTQTHIDIPIPQPEFDRYQLVTLYWAGQETPTKVVARRYDIDADTWSYCIHHDLWVSGSVLEARD